MKGTPWLFTLVVAACSGDRPPPEPPPDPSEPFEDPVTSGSGTTGPIMQNPPTMAAKSTETSSASASGGTPGTASSGTLGTSSSTTHGHPHAQVPIPHGPVGVGGMGATTGTLGSTVTGSPPRGVTTDGNIR